ncbi:hypothetical protein HYALB_00004570 [Hymenoscyphus albidus]|uniref:Uncharacterized protein n=1 Tax=Hymenoscyphus albidus TaxID=595503 RepID=A0A9N9M0J0_9HELO|nr:hypothetical protein HYALB_00004570 [Hymenoscyphus albidus]
MSFFGVGVVDIWHIIKGTISLCRTARNAGESLQVAEKEIKLMKKTVRVLKDQIGDEAIFIKERSDIASIVRSTLSPLKSNLKEIRSILKAYRDPTAILSNRLRYLKDKKRFDELLSKFGGHRQRISLILDLIRSKSQREQTTKLEGIIEQQKKEQKELRKNQEEISQLIKDSIASLQANERANTENILSRLQAGLLAKGMNAQEAKTCKNSVWERAIQKAKDPFPYAKLPTFSYAQPNTDIGGTYQDAGTYHRILETTSGETMFSPPKQPAGFPTSSNRSYNTASIIAPIYKNTNVGKVPKRSAPNASTKGAKEK